MGDWMKVTEQLPPMERYVLCYCPVTEDMLVAHRVIYQEHEEWRAVADAGYECRMDEAPSFWMELPFAPNS